ncbi:serine/threonine protein kinase [Thermophilibacter sp.]
MNDSQVIHALGIDDAYEVDRVLASGPGGVTELVSLDGSGPFVRKRIPAALARRGVWASLAECGSARLPRVVATYEMPDEFVVVCDFVPGENLEDLVRSRGRLAEKDARQALLQLCEPVAALHAHGIVHRDISPANVIMAADGAHLIDLGIARFRTEGVTHDTTQLGTRGFASPEQCGYAQTDARSDVYSLGRVFGYLLTGVLPETPDSVEYERILADEGIVSPEAREIIRRASALEPSARYQSVDELVAALSGEKVEGVAAVVPADGRAGGATASARDGRHARRWPLVLVAAAAVVVACVALVAVWALRPGAAGDAPAAQQPVASTGGGADTGAGASGSQGAPAAAPSATNENPLEIVESGWSAGSGGYINYAFALRNNSTDQLISFPTVTIVGRLSDGTVAFSQDQLFSEINPGETIWFGMSGGNGTVPDDVQFSVVAPEDHDVTRSTAAAPRYEASNVSVVSGGYVDSITGEVSLLSAGDGVRGGDIGVAAVLRDADGTIVYGYMTHVDRPAEGELAPFEIPLLDAPAYASYEVHVTEL